MMGHPGRAAGIAVLYGIVFIALPIAFIRIVSGILTKNGLDPSEYFHGTETYVLIFGVLLVLFAAMTAYFEKGSRARLGVGIIGALFLVLWAYFFIKSMSIFYEGDTYSYEVLVPGIALIFALSFSVRFIYRVVEYAVYRPEFTAPPVPVVPQPYIPYHTVSAEPAEPPQPVQENIEDEEEYF